MSSIEQSTSAEANEVQRMEMARQIGRLAAQLRDTAERVERYSQQLATGDREAAAVVADAINEYEQLNVGPIMWGIVRDLSRTV